MSTSSTKIIIDKDDGIENIFEYNLHKQQQEEEEDDEDDLDALSDLDDNNNEIHIARTPSRLNLLDTLQQQDNMDKRINPNPLTNSMDLKESIQPKYNRVVIENIYQGNTIESAEACNLLIEALKLRKKYIFADRIDYSKIPPIDPLNNDYKWQNPLDNFLNKKNKKKKKKQQKKSSIMMIIMKYVLIKVFLKFMIQLVLIIKIIKK